MISVTVTNGLLGQAEGNRARFMSRNFINGFKKKVHHDLRNKVLLALIRDHMCELNVFDVSVKTYLKWSGRQFVCTRYEYAIKVVYGLMWLSDVCKKICLL